MPEMIFVDSSNVEAIGYDPATRELRVLSAKLRNLDQTLTFCRRV
jgi:hypothetical protein